MAIRGGGGWGSLEISTVKRESVIREGDLELRLRYSYLRSLLCDVTVLSECYCSFLLRKTDQNFET